MEVISPQKCDVRKKKKKKINLETLDFLDDFVKNTERCQIK